MPTTRVDPHVKVLDEDVVERAKTAGVEVLVYAPHFTRLPDVRERAERYSDEELLVVPGREVFTGSYRDRKHVLAVGLDDPVPDFVTLGGALSAFDDQDAAVLAPHPTFLNVSLTPGDVSRYREHVDAVETYNPKHLAYHNKRAAELAHAQAIEPYASSYAHRPETIGEVWTEFDAAIETEADLVAALRGDVERRTYHHRGPRHRGRCFAEKLHLGWENTWKKVDRVFLSGMEPTHPRHIAYDDAFDDAAVY